MYIVHNNKFDDSEALIEWLKVSDEDMAIILGVMEYQNNDWNNFDQQYMPRASNWLKKRAFMDERVYLPYKNKINRINENIEFQKNSELANENAATPEEIREILSEWKK